jgi:pantoate--beta-alanine ligase
MVDAREEWPFSRKVGFVPTMGYLHEGHLTLARQARRENDVLIASIYVNPAQFGPHEDLNTYPRDLPRDLRLLEEEGVDVVFVPASAEMYPAGFVTYVDPAGPLVEQAEGASRPGHFRGVATVVLKLFEIIRPHRAYFGQKDGQQVAVIARIVKDFNLPVQLRILPTVRESDGLAMSSRNAYLNAEQRATATVLSRALDAGRATWEHWEHTPGADQNGKAKVESVRQAMTTTIADEPAAILDYADVCHPDTFAPLTALTAPALLAIAAKVGSTRLIDNYLLRADGVWDTGVRLAGEA